MCVLIAHEYQTSIDAIGSFVNAECAPKGIVA